MSESHLASTDNATPYFFLSYAHTPRADASDTGDPDARVVDLYTDLCSHIMQFTSLPSGAKPGFMDRELRPGNDWPSALSRALATCRVFVPLYSPRYFESKQCGKEWSAFSHRVLKHAAGAAGRPEAIVPAIWLPVPIESLPEAARSIQFDHQELGAPYLTHGFYGIIKLKRYRDVYEEAVYGLARHIVNVARQWPVKPGQPEDYESLESAFVTTRPHPAEERRHFSNAPTAGRTSKKPRLRGPVIDQRGSDV